MKLKTIFSFLFLFTVGQSFCQDVLHGRITHPANPCNQSPCLPGTVYAIENDTAEFIISINNHWVLIAPLIINNDTINYNDSLSVFGVIKVKKDSLNKIYYEIEVDSAFNHTTTFNSERINDISIYPNPSEGSFFIKSDVSPLKRIEIFNSSGILFYSQSVLTNSVPVYLSEKGVYFLKIEKSDHKMFNYKIIIR